ncbi:sensor domain-containing diguanylate cyclase [Pseudoduganella violacea]|uniref:diguanylate cyclase n=1 Tax=Pseudoduganella violacea TaxID=1715466 RepID=A0A7W5BBE1_9BURK|nr:GGDEF domain-containing protein [Pseudoduganella violacea]MBB3119883.1 diguanylate cyclase (GGDEF)-like protein [Pseudoduganella violacea]
MSLRSKLMLALLLTGLASVALVGGLTYISVNAKVDSIRQQQAAQHFHSFMTAYLAEYGDWQTAIASESFDQFVQRRQARAPQGERPSDLLERMPPEVDRQSHHEPDAGQRRAPPPHAAPPHNGPQRMPPDGHPRHRPLLPGAGQEPPPPMLEAPPPVWPPENPPPHEARPRRDGPPLFRFLLTDAEYRVLLGAGLARNGSILPVEMRKGLRPLLVEGRTVAYVSPQSVLTPTPQEREYLAAIRSSLLAGVAAATALALGLGLLLSRSLSSRLSYLTNAVRAMHKGSLLQQVPVRGKDEVAELATAFNAMSEDLARSHAELNASHQTILQQAAQLRELSIRDGLTGLYNRRHFDEQATTLFKQAVRHQRPLSLMIGDIDYFKRINDQFSHAIGDAVLRQVSALLRDHIRQSDLVARYGGEEFVLALPETAGPQAVALCEKLRRRIEDYPWQEIHPCLKVTMSMGVSVDVASGSAEAMLRQADALLYQAKGAGRNQVCFA